MSLIEVEGRTTAMLAKTRRRIEMGGRALAFSIAHPHPSRGCSIALAELERLITRGKELMAFQSSGTNELQGATALRSDLRSTMRRTHMTHIARVAVLAAKEEDGLEKVFRMVREDSPYMVFLSAARHFAVEAERRRTMLTEHGLADTMLDGLREAVEKFDRLNKRIIEMQRQRVGATTELRGIGSEIVRRVGVLDALNRNRFAGNRGVLAEWLSSSKVLDRGPSASPEPAPSLSLPEVSQEGSDLKPAA
jgi:hypothetical protein